MNDSRETALSVKIMAERASAKCSGNGGGRGGMIQIPLTTRCAAPRCWTITLSGVPEGAK